MCGCPRWKDLKISKNLGVMLKWRSFGATHIKKIVELIGKFIDIFIRLGRHLNWVIPNYGLWTYLLLFLIIFCETGLVVTPILPGDSLLFAAGTFAANGSLKAGWLFPILSVAAVAGDTVNYWIGYLVGPKVFHKEKVRFLNKEYLDRTHQFYEKYGRNRISSVIPPNIHAKTTLIARPTVR